MDAIIGANTIPLSQVAAPPSGVPGYPTDGNPGMLIPATDFPAYHYAGIIVELLSIIQAAGITPSSANNTQVLAAIQTLIARATPIPPPSPTFLPVLAPGGTFGVPANVGHIEAILDGGGGGGSNAQGLDWSGAGGGGGGHLHAVWAVTPGQTVIVTVGAGGGNQVTGGTTYLVIGGVVVGTATGGQGASFTNPLLSLGALGGQVTASGSNILVSAQAGERGSDGQFGTEFAFAGHGAAGFYGGGGPAGYQGGDTGTAPGAGGGGAYDVSQGTDPTPWRGGSGFAGRFAYRWLP